uniref:Uncharacterized protein n=1 Tax=Opuntia streptacantha TaxID=393608 RepID=A0A7C8YQ59_OPUST
MRKRKSERKSQFLEVIGQIQRVSAELYGSAGYDISKAVVDENDLSLRRLEELQTELQSLQKEKVLKTLTNSSLPLPAELLLLLPLVLIVTLAFNLQSDRLRQVMEHLSVLSSLCSVLGVDFEETVRTLHPSLAGSEETRSFSTETLQQLESVWV